MKMHLFKKVLAVVMTIAMLLTSGITVFAETENGNGPAEFVLDFDESLIVEAVRNNGEILTINSSEFFSETM